MTGRRRLVKLGVKDVCKLVRDGEMPMTSYLWMHSEARLNERDVDLICAWTSGRS